MLTIPTWRKSGLRRRSPRDSISSISSAASSSSSTSAISTPKSPALLTSYRSIDSGLGQASSSEENAISKMGTPSFRNASILTTKTSFNDRTLRNPLTGVCLIGQCGEDSILEEKLTECGVNVFKSIDGEEFVTQEDVGFVVDQFDGSIFDRLNEAKKPIYGPTAVMEYAVSKEIPRSRRPVYCRSMEGIVVTFSGFGRDKFVLERLVNLVHWMGGSVRQKFVAKVTHVVSSTTQSEKYRLAVAAGIPIMSEEWVRRSWERRSTVHAHAFNDEMKSYKLPAFYGLKLAFHGFPTEDVSKMEERALELGAEVVEASTCTRYVVCCESTSADGFVSPNNDECRLVSGEWFWTSASLDFCANETEYPAFSKNSNGPFSPSAGESSKSHTSANWPRPNRRRSSNSIATNGGGHLDVSNDVSCMLDEHMFSMDDIESFMKSPKKSGVSKRRLACAELLQTESNYVRFLKVAIALFKEPCETVDAFGDRLLDPIEVKTIFHNIPDIIAIHEKIQCDLTAVISNWNEKTCSIGQVYLKHIKEIAQVYPPYINFQSNAIEMLNKCVEKNKRFEGFLKANLSKPECDKNSLKDILIRPIQRLGSVVLLFGTIKKDTDKSHADFTFLQQAIDAMNGVLRNCNEGKRNIDAKKQLFEILEEIEGCPVDLISSQRQLVAEVDVTDLSAVYCKKRTSILTFYLFNDCLEIAKKQPKSGAKIAKHKDLIPLSRVRRVINIVGDSDEMGTLFGVTFRDNLSDTDFVFNFLGSGRRNSFGSTSTLDIKAKKLEFLDQVNQAVVNTTGRCGLAPEDFALVANSNDDTPLSNAITRAVRRIKDDGTLKRSVSTRTMGRQASTFGRSISQRMLGLAGTMRRVSRTNIRMNLQEIVEEAANLSKGKNDSSLINT